MVTYSGPTFVSSQLLPDIAGGVAGRGFTSTGVTYDASTDSFWIANEGRVSPYINFFTPSLVNVSADGSTLISEIDLSPHTNKTVQGLVIDPDGGSLWFTTGNNKLMNVGFNGALLNSRTLVKSGSSLAYDASTDAFIVVSNDGSARRYDHDTLDLVDTFDTTVTKADHAWIDNDNNILWISAGGNHTDGKIFAYNLGSMQYLLSYTLAGADAIEGILIDIDNSRLYVTNDGYFHRTQSFENSLLTYEFTYDSFLSDAGLLAETSVIYGTEFSDTLDGTDNSDDIDGLGGNDTILGGTGEDTIYGGVGSDVLYGGGGGDIIIGDNVDDSNRDALIDTLLALIEFSDTATGLRLQALIDSLTAAAAQNNSAPNTTSAAPQVLYAIEDTPSEDRLQTENSDGSASLFEPEALVLLEPFDPDFG